MKQCRITVMRVARYDDLIAQYENPIQHACDMTEGQVFLANGWEKPAGFCQSAWDTLSYSVLIPESMVSSCSRSPSSFTSRPDCSLSV